MQKAGHFNSHARVGRDACRRGNRSRSGTISTHTPAWGVTNPPSVYVIPQLISTHTPAWGVTSANCWQCRPCRFQLTRPRGALPDGTCTGVICPEISTHTPAWGVTSSSQSLAATQNISTHTPAWGVTLTPLTRYSGALNFNSHARVGRDDILKKLREDNGIFQLTRPRGA